MRLFAALLFLSLAIELQAAKPYASPKVVAIQVSRCPTPTLYTNDQEEEKTVPIPKGSTQVVKADFDESIRFHTNETGTITFFVTANGPFEVSIYRDPTVLRMNHTKITVNQGDSVVFTVPFEVIKGVAETTIRVVVNDGVTEKSTTVYASTISLEPPRPPTKFTSIFSDSDNSSAQNELESATPPSIVMNSTVGALQNVTASNWTTVEEVFPTAEDILNGKLANNNSDIHLDSITMNRVSHNISETYTAVGQIYEIPMHRNETGLIMFNVSGSGDKKITLKSIAGKTHVIKQADIGEKPYGAFAYTVNDNRVEKDRCLLKIQNSKNATLYFYVTMTKND